ncbi:MAG TPA: sensor domain-containing diguanylate cyclase [Patescibacteria group bacterium]|nr:sensor domain-containing diguanylate cyclase [Patescibacteria group bacterium]
MFFSGNKGKIGQLCAEIVAQSDDAVVIVDSGHRIVLFNKGAEEMFGYSQKETRGERLDLLMPERFQLQNEAMLDEIGAEASGKISQQRRNRQLHGRRKDGNEFVANAQILRLSQAGAVYYAAIFHDISQSKKTEEELLRLAATDPLTGAYNRREFSAMAEREALRSHRYHHPLSLIMFDLDLFKKLNDSFGHTAGDKALQRFTALCTNTLRNVDIFARWGGEEFVALLPETDIEGASIIAERLRKIVSESVLTYNDHKITFTVSIGIAQFKDGETTIEGPLSRADSAVYDAKKAGRNRISAFRN